jgi:ATP-dependent phosphofructokinase / diphosphate-dependent phosphofructokinase
VGVLAAGNFGIIVSGGPAPGINTVIASVVIRAINEGYQVKGFQGGFAGIDERGMDAVRDLTITQVRPYVVAGGSMLGTSRFNPFQDAAREQKFYQTLRESEVDKLVVIGGEGSAYLSSQITKRIPNIRVAHIPKTIDNDLILPNTHPSFGFETARFESTRILKTIIEDAKTTNRWFVIRTMGRKAGYLALGAGVAAGTTLTLIAEEFSQEYITPDDVARPIFESVKRRLAEGKRYGTAVLAEGIIDKFDPNNLDAIKDTPRDDMGRLRFAEVKLEDLVAASLRRMCKAEGITMRFSTENVGYELRCCDPISFDIEYTRLLGYGAVHYLLQGLGGFMVVKDFDSHEYVLLADLIDSATGVLKTRKVDLESDVYKMARSYMIR